MPSFEKFLATIRDTTRRSLSTEKSGSLLRNGSRSDLPPSALIESVIDHPFHSARKPDQGVSGGNGKQLDSYPALTGESIGVNSERDEGCRHHLFPVMSNCGRSVAAPNGRNGNARGSAERRPTLAGAVTKLGGVSGA